MVGLAVRVIIQGALLCLLGWLFCDINSFEVYSWYSGLWHGLFLPANFVRHLIWEDVLYIAPLHTVAYTVWYWIVGILSILSFFLRRGRR
ncbi:MAG: hypothetical protein ACFNQF_01020 [Bacteroides sp.]